ncbi:hypothetical protein [Crenobacter cavernae]|uniref:Uncharacterized protein n=1 Tax=Crenobacter cavernae TaxID=2290923 RepID=A0ABY0FB60_9NEIS|nr:hypothetical protein [Crenobacter cavernae]RXZ43121.1 hypothetical protein EBB06_10895 [Crenobacter cavernae]
MRNGVWALGLALLGGVANAASWQLAEPVADPIEARVKGTVSFGRESVPAELALSCRRDAPPAWTSVRLLGKPKGFDLAPFEGPGGAGEKGRLASYAVGRARFLPVKVSGAWAESGVFGLTFALPAREAAALVDVRQLQFRLKPAKGRASPLEARFDLPGDSAPLRRTLQGCGA